MHFNPTIITANIIVATMSLNIEIIVATIITNTIVNFPYFNLEIKHDCLDLFIKVVMKQPHFLTTLILNSRFLARIIHQSIQNIF